MEYHIEYVHSARFMTDIGLRYWVRTNWKGYILWLGLPLMTLCMCLASPDMTSSRKGLFYTGILLGAVLMIVIQFLYYLTSFPKAAEKAFRKQNGQTVSTKFDEVGITYSYKGMSGHYPWKNFTSLWQQPQGWLMFYGERQYIPLPIAFLDTELQQFIIRKITEAGGKITR